jgi:hypothetical protein
MQVELFGNDVDAILPNSIQIQSMMQPPRGLTRRPDRREAPESEMINWVQSSHHHTLSVKGIATTACGRLNVASGKTVGVLHCAVYQFGCRDFH